MRTRVAVIADYPLYVQEKLQAWYDANPDYSYIKPIITSTPNEPGYNPMLIAVLIWDEKEDKDE